MSYINAKLAAIAIVSLTAFSTLSFAQPPAAALEACEGKADGAVCSFSNEEMGDVAGFCYTPRENTFVCATEDMIAAQRARQAGEAVPESAGY